MSDETRSILRRAAPCRRRQKEKPLVSSIDRTSSEPTGLFCSISPWHRTGNASVTESSTSAPTIGTMMLHGDANETQSRGEKPSGMTAQSTTSSGNGR